MLPRIPSFTARRHRPLHFPTSSRSFLGVAKRDLHRSGLCHKGVSTISVAHEQPKTEPGIPTVSKGVAITTALATK